MERGRGLPRGASVGRATVRATDDSPARIYAVVKSIPRGRVATYGEVAELAGLPSGHRVVARAMRTCPERLPWQRVVGRKDARRAQISIGEAEHAALQRALLESEGVVFDDSGFIVLRESGWSSAPEPARKQRARSGARRKKRTPRTAPAQRPPRKISLG